MDFGDISTQGLVLLGCGKMGGAMLKGWLARGLDAGSIWVIDPAPGDWLSEAGVHVNEDLPLEPAVVVVAVKPQMMAEALPGLVGLGERTLIISIAAATRIAYFEDMLGKETPVVRAMPNTPAAIGRGITALIGNDNVSEDRLELVEALLAAVGSTVRLESERQMDAVTAVSGSGPAYVFHLIETMAAAGVAEGLGEDLALELARATVAGAGALAMESTDSPSQLRVNVTSPAGTTEAALRVLMGEENGFPALLRAAVHAAAERGRELGG